jgi:hydrogenase 3 maturation protease
MENIFKNILKGKVVVLGVGNPLRCDDGFGPALIKELTDNFPYKGHDALFIDAGTAPENYMGKITKIKPDTLLIVDAVDLGVEPGGYALLGKSDIRKQGFTTHDLSPDMLMDFLEKEAEIDIYLLGVQPESISFGTDMSEAVQKTVLEVSKLIKERMSNA